MHTLRPGTILRRHGDRRITSPKSGVDGTVNYTVIMRKPIAKLMLLLSAIIVGSTICDAQTVTTDTNFYSISPCTNYNPAKLGFEKARRTAPGRGVLNRRIVCGILPEYPQDARTFSGEVTVDVFYNDRGVVITAQASGGTKRLRASAVRAVRATYFGPTLLGGESVNVRGAVIYKFDTKRGVWLPNIPL